VWVTVGDQLATRRNHENQVAYPQNNKWIAKEKQTVGKQAGGGKIDASVKGDVLEPKGPKGSECRVSHAPCPHPIVLLVASPSRFIP